MNSILDFEQHSNYKAAIKLHFQTTQDFNGQGYTRHDMQHFSSYLQKMFRMPAGPTPHQLLLSPIHPAAKCKKQARNENISLSLNQTWIIVCRLKIKRLQNFKSHQLN